ncbi:hypothetical protein QFZ49_003313 [Streptomyces turgidiscabies]|uniref:Uncharacterized protein n=1 Tax=Streptomyces turgidiscabies TaxID=85558 RepID=A0ABU0RNS7_9ACTN|nr:hypothetical protein [Streptomyces turgidiscabies]
MPPRDAPSKGVCPPAVHRRGVTDPPARLALGCQRCCRPVGETSGGRYRTSTSHPRVGSSTEASPVAGPPAQSRLPLEPAARSPSTSCSGERGSDQPRRRASSRSTIPETGGTASSSEGSTCGSRVGCTPRAESTTARQNTAFAPYRSLKSAPSTEIPFASERNLVHHEDDAVVLGRCVDVARHILHRTVSWTRTPPPGHSAPVGREPSRLADSHSCLAAGAVGYGEPEPDGKAGNRVHDEIPSPDGGEVQSAAGRGARRVVMRPTAVRTGTDDGRRVGVQRLPEEQPQPLAGFEETASRWARRFRGEAGAFVGGELFAQGTAGFERQRRPHECAQCDGGESPRHTARRQDRAVAVASAIATPAGKEGVSGGSPPRTPNE